MTGPGDCNLVGPLGIAMQGSITVVCAVVLVGVWWMETPRRSFLVWGFDISKQVVSAAYGKLYNILQAIVLANVLVRNVHREDQCVWYLMGIVTDCFITTFLCWILTRSLRPILLVHCGIDIGGYEADEEHLPSGVPPPKVAALRNKYVMYVVQLLLWLLVVTCARLVVTAGFFFGQGFLYDFYKGVFTELGLTDPAAKMIFAVLIFPALGDAFQIIVQDCFLKRKMRRNSVEGYRAVAR